MVILHALLLRENIVVKHMSNEFISNEMFQLCKRKHLANKDSTALVSDITLKTPSKRWNFESDKRDVILKVEVKCKKMCFEIYKHSFMTTLEHAIRNKNKKLIEILRQQNYNQKFLGVIQSDLGKSRKRLMALFCKNYLSFNVSFTIVVNLW